MTDHAGLTAGWRSVRGDDVRAVFRATDDLLHLLKHHDQLGGSLEAALRELRGELTDVLCPYTVEQLDAHKRLLDAREPRYEHWYIRCSGTVTWCDRRKQD